MYCHNCGKRMNDDDVFCSGCGEKAKNEPVEENAFEETDVSNPITNEQEADSADGKLDNGDVITDEQPEADAREQSYEQIKPLEEESVTEDTTSTEDVVSDNDIIPEEKTTTETEADTLEETDTTEFTLAEENMSAQTVQAEPESCGEQVINTPDYDEGYKSYSYIEIDSQSKKRAGRSVGACIASVISTVLLCFVLVGLVGALAGQIFIRTAVTEKRIKEALRNADLTEIKADGILDLEYLSEKYETEIPDDATIAEVIYYCLDQEEFVNPITKSEVNRLVQRLDYQSFVANKAERAVEIIRTGSDEQVVTARELTDFLRDNSEIIEITIGIDIIEVDYEYMEKYMEENNESILNMLSAEQLSERLGVVGYGFLRFLWSDWFIGVLCVLIAGIAVALGFINRSLGFSLMFTGIPFVFVGAPILLGSVGYRLVMNMLSPRVSAEFFIKISAPFLDLLTVIGVVSLSLGLLLIAIGVIAKTISKKTSNTV